MACREDARQIIKRVFGCSKDDAVIFVGSGSTSASNLLVSKLKIKQAADFANLRLEAEKFIAPENLFTFLANMIPADLEAKNHCIRLDWN